MKLRQDQRGFVLSGIALLLVLPAMLLATSCFTIIEMGGEATALQASADKVFYTGKDIERIIENLWGYNLLFDNENNANATFAELAENYRAATGLLVDITPSWMLWSYLETRDENHYAGTIDCRIERVGPNNWRYHFEQLWIIIDYNEPILLVTKLNGSLQITLEEYDTIFPLYRSDIYYSDNKLWDDVINNDSRLGGNVVVDGTTQLIVSVHVRDPRGAAQYSSTVELG
ncbi:hypothetical protein ES703_11476 [subsurface metagenome]